MRIPLQLLFVSAAQNCLFFREVLAGYYSNKSAVQCVLLNWFELRLRARERESWGGWGFNKTSCMNSSIQTCVVHYSTHNEP